MAIAGEMTRIVAEALAIPHSEASSYFRVLRDGGLITSGARGRNAPPMTSLDVSRLVICLLSAEALAQGVAATGLVGGLVHTGTIEAEKLHLLDDHPVEGEEWTEDRPEDWEPETINFEQALAALIKASAELRKQGKVPADWSLGTIGDWFPGAPDGRLQVSVTSTALRANIQASGLCAMFYQEEGSRVVTDPDDWTGMTISERMRAKTVIGGMSVTRAITQTELYWLAKAVMP